MFTLLLWIGVFVLGLVIYFAPVFLSRRMYEGFTEEDDIKVYLKNLREIVKPQVTGTASPDGAETIRSRPSPTNQPSQKSQVLAQGAAFNETVPKLTSKQTSKQTSEKDPKRIPEVETPANSAVGLVSSSIPHICPPRKIKYIEVPKACPDMSQYIRKDSIPCWSCKLG